ncbi:hypothetical protein AB0J57_32660 [Streptomyces sp. NPDC049837]|uniref:hypothetical protein n=1 Tax=Streptomyces sp. NPDC049837 TaxID=3155277 RepID=UPI003424940E
MSRSRRPRSPVQVLARVLLVTLAWVLGVPAMSAAQAPTVLVTRVDGAITPG